MKFKLIIDTKKDEEIVATVHNRTHLIDEIETLILAHAGADRIPGYSEMLSRCYLCPKLSALRFLTEKPMQLTQKTDATVLSCDYTNWNNNSPRLSSASTKAH